MGINAARRRNFFLEHLTTFENLLKLWMFVIKHTKFTHVMQLVGKILVPSSWEWGTPFNLPGEAVMR